MVEAEAELWKRTEEVVVDEKVVGEAEEEVVDSFSAAADLGYSPWHRVSRWMKKTV